MLFERRAFILSAGGAAAATAALAARPAMALAAPFAPGERLTGKAIVADLDLFERAYATVHPGLGRYLPPGGFAARIAAARRWAAGGRTLPELYVALSRITAAVRCGHSHVNPANQSRRVEEGLLGARDRLPLAFRWIDGRMIVTGARGGGPVALAPGTEILTVDGTPAPVLLRAMLPLARADGGNDAKRVAQLGLASADLYAAFDIFRGMLFPVRADGSAVLAVRPPGGGRQTVALPTLSAADLGQQKRGPGGGEGWTFVIDKAGIGLLTMPDWVTYRSKWDWQAYLDGVIDRLIDERARGLVIDLRGNEGGTECGWRILDRLIAREIAVPRYRQMTRYRTLPADLHKPLDTWDPTFRDWGAAASGPDEAGFYRLTRSGDARETLVPRGRRYAGKVAVLVDSSCSSATFQFAQAVKASGAAMLVGEPTGGNRRGINGGAYFFVRLPESGLEVDLPIIGYFPPGREPDAGILPDLIVRPTAADIALGRDRAMAAARAIVLRG